MPVATYKSPSGDTTAPFVSQIAPFALGRDLVALERPGAGDGQVDDVAVVLAAVTVEAAEVDVEPPVRQRHGGALLLGGDVVVARVVGIGRIDVPVPELLVAREADRDEPVADPLPAGLAGQFGLLGGEDLAGPGVDDGSARDAERVDVPATHRGRRVDHRLAAPSARRARCQSTLPVPAAMA